MSRLYKSNCWACGAEMIWETDESREDYGLDGEGIVSHFSCSQCNATAVFYHPYSERWDKDDG